MKIAVRFMEGGGNRENRYRVDSWREDCGDGCGFRKAQRG